jgi:hypothetical protein
MVPLWPAPNKRGHLRLSIRPVVKQRAMITLPSDAVPNNQIVKRTVAQCELSAAKHRETIFSKALLSDHDRSAPIARSIARCSDSTVRCWMKIMCGIYPTASYLYRIGKVPSPVCTHCNLQVPETTGHFACVCPKFHNARTAAHDLSWAPITHFIAKHAGPDWTFQWGKTMASSGFNLESVSVEGTAQAAEVSRLKPDGLAINSKSRRILILEYCRPSDSHPAQIQAAYYRKLLKYEVIKEALAAYSRAGWLVTVLPWVVGIRGLVDVNGLHQAMSALNIPQLQWAEAANISAMASVESFTFMHRVRFGVGSHLDGLMDGPVIIGQWKRKPGNGSKPLTQEDAAHTYSRWKRMITSNQGRRSASNSHAQLISQIHPSSSGQNWPPTRTSRTASTVKDFNQTPANDFTPDSHLQPSPLNPVALPASPLHHTPTPAPHHSNTPSTSHHQSCEPH